MYVRNTLALVILTFCYSVCIGQNNYQNEISKKLQNALEMKETGQNLFQVGIIGIPAGIYFTVEGAKKVKFSLLSSGIKNEDELLSGIVILIASQAIMITGVSLWITGGSRSNRYKKMLKKTPRDLGLAFCKEGFGIYYKF